MLPIRFRTTPNGCRVITVQEPFALFAGFLNGEGTVRRTERLLGLIDDSLLAEQGTIEFAQDYAVVMLDADRKVAQLSAENVPTETIEECEMPLDLLRQITSEWLNYLNEAEEDDA